MTKILKSKSEYLEALAELKRLVALDPDSETPEGDELELLAVLIEEYESREYPFNNPDPIDALLFRMEQQGLTPQDLAPFLGSPSTVSEILNRKRTLTLEMIRALHAGLGLPADILIQEYSATPH